MAGTRKEFVSEGNAALKYVKQILRETMKAVGTDVNDVIEYINKNKFKRPETAAEKAARKAQEQQYRDNAAENDAWGSFMKRPND